MRRLIRGPLAACLMTGLVVFALLATPQAQATGSGSFNWERTYFNANHGEVYVERAPRLIWNPNAPRDSYEPNGMDWYANMESYSNGCPVWKCVPSVLNVQVYIRDTTSCGQTCNAYWLLNRFWPVSTSEYGTTVQWTFSITGGGENLQGGISATVTGTNVHKITADYKAKPVADGWRYLGGITIDIAEQPGWNQVFVQGGFRIAILNANGVYVDNHYTWVKTVWQASWRGCGWLACWGSEYWFTTSMIHGDGWGQGDGWIWVRRGDSNEP